MALVTTEIDRFDSVRQFAGQLPLGAAAGRRWSPAGSGRASIPSSASRRCTPASTSVPHRPAIPATAAGTVVSAGENGGYGNMVEIDHGNGVSTRCSPE